MRAFVRIGAGSADCSPGTRWKAGPRPGLAAPRRHGKSRSDFGKENGPGGRKRAARAALIGADQSMLFENIWAAASKQVAAEARPASMRTATRDARQRERQRRLRSGRRGFWREAGLRGGIAGNAAIDAWELRRGAWRCHRDMRGFPRSGPVWDSVRHRGSPGPPS